MTSAVRSASDRLTRADGLPCFNLPPNGCCLFCRRRRHRRSSHHRFGLPFLIGQTNKRIVKRRLLFFIAVVCLLVLEQGDVFGSLFVDTISIDFCVPFVIDRYRSCRFFTSSAIHTYHSLSFSLRHDDDDIDICNKLYDD